jgi:hypothetical protein
VLQREPVTADQRDHAGGVRAVGPDYGVVAVFVGAQDAVRVVVLAGDQAGQVTRLGRLVRGTSLLSYLRHSSGIRASDGMSGMLMT